MSEHASEDASQIGIGDDQLPEDLVPGDDNPLANRLDPDETVDDLLTGGKLPEQGDGQDDGQDTGQDDGQDPGEPTRPEE